MSEPQNRILQVMLDRLFASIVSGPSLNCRPHNSRQRIDWAHLESLNDADPTVALRTLLGDDRAVRLTGRVAAPGDAPTPPKGLDVEPKASASEEAEEDVEASESRVDLPTGRDTGSATVSDAEAAASVESTGGDEADIEQATEDAEVEESAESGAADQDAASARPTKPKRDPAAAYRRAVEEHRRATRMFNDQKRVLSKLRLVAEEAKTYENDTGVYVLNVGFPLLSLNASALIGGGARRVLAPLAFVPVNVTVKAGAQPGVELACREDEVDRVVPNTALLAWLEQQTGKSSNDRVLFEDEDGAEPWAEICDIVRHVCTTLEIEIPDAFTQETWPDNMQLRAAPRSDETGAEPQLFCSSVLGLFPMSNQGLLRDTQAMLEGDSIAGPVESFIRVDVSLEQQPDEEYDHETSTGGKTPRSFVDERLVAIADPCQARAVNLVRTCKGLVIHGPPGTGKSQTITNIIGDHLARDERVLFVCDKRTALDVVATRLEYLDIGGLCAVVHDPQRDQKDLYRSIRNELENLTEVKTDAKAAAKLDRIDAELQTLHDELTGHWRDLMEPDEKTGVSFHRLMGDWLAARVRPELSVRDDTLADTTLAAYQDAEADLEYVFERGEAVGYSGNPWAKAAGTSLSAFLSRPMDEIRQVVRETTPVAKAADRTRHDSIPAFSVTVDLLAQGAARTRVADLFERVLSDVDPELAASWVGQDVADLQRASQRLKDLDDSIERFNAASLDQELAMMIVDAPPNIATIARQIASLEAYLASCERWYGFLAFGDKSRAKSVLLHYGQQLGPEAAQRVVAFLEGLRDRLLLSALIDEFDDVPPTGRLLDDKALRAMVDGHAVVLELLTSLHDNQALLGLFEMVGDALRARGNNAEDPHAATMLDGLRRSEERAKALHDLEQAMIGTKLIHGDWMSDTTIRWRGGAEAEPDVEALNDRLDTLEDVLRIGDTLNRLPAPLAAGTRQLLGRPIAAAEGTVALRKAVLTVEIRRRLTENSRLQQIDSHRLKNAFDRYRTLDHQKLKLVRKSILHNWIGKQQERLLVGTRSRLNSAGADLRRRLTMRGKHAMRLRQVVDMGRKIEGGDPLMDMCPVWMASPETVAQVFPREPVFDVVIFDEASQCRLEEALPVLTRAKRFVIAGDPKQLPPTRFFESAVTNTDAEEIETDQDLFEAHQGEIEDLLNAALSLDIQQCYLDVHYRSQNSDLIEFSNEQFYSKRLQAIPGHPANVAKYPPLTLYRADGTYVDRTNPAEADRVVQIVADLLKRSDAPSIGIACFNVTQRDLIAEKLDEAASNDATFARRLDKARSRRGEGSFEGLFVKNLENVQGDERDHIIISTTYGPNEEGKFYRRFGPLGRAGGGRRLNVLVTRARQEVHLVTSIPTDVYRSLPPVPQGQTPNGGYLLFAYLHFAERLADLYQQARQEESGQASVSPDERETPRPLRVSVRDSEYPSRFAEALAREIAITNEHASVVHWGNDGFCVDVALRHPNRPDNVTIGVLCDGCRFAQAEDMVEWDVFRAAMLEGQGWALHRVWTPQFFRDPKGIIDGIQQHIDDVLIEEAGRSDPTDSDARDPSEM